ncbi:hypothetical protein BB560_005318 [Smittium megazygosporum]|uniref:Uncharacterized protein n=1 Tax=Smittium megazygosporum TaxID=133381 RepID=A0A2T9Z6S9_9FUNG|nr:hypothetical protein BB560_005318 [Smittium megazygosporum]
MRIDLSLPLLFATLSSFTTSASIGKNVENKDNPSIKESNEAFQLTVRGSNSYTTNICPDYGYKYNDYEISGNTICVVKNGNSPNSPCFRISTSTNSFMDYPTSYPRGATGIIRRVCNISVDESYNRVVSCQPDDTAKCEPIKTNTQCSTMKQAVKFYMYNGQFCKCDNSKNPKTIGCSSPISVGENREAPVKSTSTTTSDTCTTTSDTCTTTSDTCTTTSDTCTTTSDTCTTTSDTCTTTSDTCTTTSDTCTTTSDTCTTTSDTCTTTSDTCTTTSDTCTTTSDTCTTTSDTCTTTSDTCTTTSDTCTTTSDTCTTTATETCTTTTPVSPICVDDGCSYNSYKISKGKLCVYRGNSKKTIFCFKFDSSQKSFFDYPYKYSGEATGLRKRVCTISNKNGDASSVKCIIDPSARCEPIGRDNSVDPCKFSKKGCSSFVSNQKLCTCKNPGKNSSKSCAWSI